MVALIFAMMEPLAFMQSHAPGLALQHWRILPLCHERRNLTEYEVRLENDVQAAKELLEMAACYWKKHLHRQRYI